MMAVTLQLQHAGKCMEMCLLSLPASAVAARHEIVGQRARAGLRAVGSDEIKCRRAQRCGASEGQHGTCTDPTTAADIYLYNSSGSVRWFTPLQVTLGRQHAVDLGTMLLTSYSETHVIGVSRYEVRTGDCPLLQLEFAAHRICRSLAGGGLLQLLVPLAHRPL